MSKVSLTRFLYYSDEVKISLLDSLLRKKKMNEIYFWLSEYYESGFKSESWLFILKIYNDFYALQYNFMKKIKNNYKLWLKNKDIKYILSVIKNIYYMTPNYEIFILFNLNNDCIFNDKISKPCKKKYKKIKNITDHDIKFINALETQDKRKILYYLKKYDLNNIEKCKQIIKIYTKKNYNYDTFGDIFHHIYVILIKFINNNSKINRKFIKMNIREMKMIKKLNFTIKPVYKTLKYKRHYYISPYINCFTLNNIIKDKTREEVLWYHWQYFACNSLLWKNRIQKFNGKKNIDTLDIDFDNDSDNENFHELYGYEPDEQNFETQEKSVLKYYNGSTYKWLDSIFKIERELNIKNTNKCIDYS
jgi:hypothetical protein